MATPRICSIPECGKPAKGRGWCGAHWNRWRSHGDPLGGRTAWAEPLRYIHDTVLAFKGHDCLVWPFSRDNHGRARIRVDGTPKQTPRIICELVYGPAPTRLHQAAHSCGKGHEGCVNPIHLRWATPSENQMDRIGHGTGNRGDRHAHAKLSDQDVREIRRMCAAGTLQKDAAALFGLSAATVSMVLARKRWGWLN